MEHRIDRAPASLLETLAARAWPAREQETTGEWLLRHTPAVGYRRLNSARPLDGVATLDDAIVAEISAFYARRARAAMVHIAPIEEHGALDAALAQRGWTLEGVTDVLVAQTDEVAAACPARRDVAVAVAPALDPPWLAAWEAIGARADARDTYEQVLTRIAEPVGFAVATVGGAPAGVGLCACEGEWSGVFCMATAPAARRRGVARAILGGLAGWSRAHGAARMYLQVVSSNAPAQALYAAAGFVRSHGYQFRAAR